MKKADSTGKPALEMTVFVFPRLRMPPRRVENRIDECGAVEFHMGVLSTSKYTLFLSISVYPVHTDYLCLVDSRLFTFVYVNDECTCNGHFDHRRKDLEAVETEWCDRGSPGKCVHRGSKFEMSKKEPQ
jgi:hypothetical protein